MPKHTAKKRKETLGRKISLGRRASIKRQQMFDIERLRDQGMSVLQICQAMNLNESRVIQILRAIRAVSNAALNVPDSRVQALAGLISVGTTVAERALTAMPLVSEEDKTRFLGLFARLLRQEAERNRRQPFTPTPP